jgi:hypothetical protein
MNAHMTEPRCLIEVVDSGSWFQVGFVGSGKWFHPQSAGETGQKPVQPVD